MIELLVDILLYILLLGAIGFGLISLIGLLIFPDIRSRTFTGMRAGIISLTLVTVAGVCYSLFFWNSTGGFQYLIYLISAVLLSVFLVILNRFIANILCHNTNPVISSYTEKDPDKNS